MKIYLVLFSAILVHCSEDTRYQGSFVKPKCHEETRKKCEKVPKKVENEVCEDTVDTFVDVVYMEECEYIDTHYCHEQHERVVPSTDAKTGISVVEASSEEDKKLVEISGPDCHTRRIKQCHQKPIESLRDSPNKVCETVVDTTYTEECKDVVIVHCDEVRYKVQQSSSIVGQESRLLVGEERDQYLRNTEESSVFA